MNHSANPAAEPVLRLVPWRIFAILATFVIIRPTLACDDWLAKAVAVEGAVERQLTTQDWQPLQPEQWVCPGENVRVGANSRAALYLRNNTFVRLDQNSWINFPARNDDASFVVELTQGLAHFISRIVNRFEVSTPYVNAVVEGTEFVVSAAAAQGAVSVMEGQVRVFNDSASQQLGAGQQTKAASRTQSLDAIGVPPATMVEWAIHYPPVLTLSQLQPGTEDEKLRLANASQYLQQNRLDLALAELEQGTATDTLQLARAALLLAAGQASAFDSAIGPLLAGPHAGNAQALKAVADAARNRPDSALAAGRAAVELAPQQAASFIALSYAQQAALQLDDAVESAGKATRVEPASSLAWLRLSELHLMHGDIAASKKALSRTKAEQHTQARLLTAQGFVDLFSLKLQRANQTFRNALKMDSGNPQNHLGLGLTLLRSGDLEAGRQHLEFAVSLDPLRSNLRSYLGRAYFEEKRDAEAIKQWALAKQFDPNDPTPYFYTGVHKLFANDPIGAIDELETSRELNDKRAIYRSETLLQSDAASRSATLARAYNEVGYDQGVLLSGWDAIRKDPTNAEGHRLLADKYAGDPRYESARVSELLQSQLWQSLTAYPLQPQLAESNLAVVAGAGPQRPGFNEYHSLFARNGVYGMVNGFGGSDGTWGNDLVGSFLAGPVAVSLGQFHYESDGWRENADQQQDVYNGFVQWQAGPRTSVQFEHRDMTWDRGYLLPTLGLAADVSTSEELSRTTDRFGLTHRHSNTSALLVSIMQQDWSVDSSSTQELHPGHTSEDAESLSAEMQWVMDLGKHHFTFGGGYFDIDSADAFLLSLGADFGGFFLETIVDRNTEKDPKLTSGYVDYLFKMNDFLNFGFGLGYYNLAADYVIVETQTLLLDGVEFEPPVTTLNQYGRDKSDWLPRLGVAYRINEKSQVSAAYFSSISKQAVIKQSIEPTTFLGFNMVYDDLYDGVESENYGIAAQYHDNKLKYGLSLVTRALQVPEEGIVDMTFSDHTENVAELFASMHSSDGAALSLGANWRQKKFDGLVSITRSSIEEIDQYKFPIKLILLGDNKLSFHFDQMFYVQDVAAAGNVGSRRSSTWITDFAVQYRFDKRHGAVRFGVKNLLDNTDEYLSFSERELAFYPGRFWFASINANF